MRRWLPLLALLVAFSIATAAVHFVGCNPPPPDRTRAELQSLLQGMTADEVRDILGEPASDTGESDGARMMTYYDVAVPDPGYQNPSVIVRLRGGRVTEVTP